MGSPCCIKRNAFPFQRKRRANDAIVGAVYKPKYSTIEILVKTAKGIPIWSVLSPISMDSISILV